MPKINRRTFLSNSVKTGLATGVAGFGFPSIVPATVMGPLAPSNRLNIAAIGTGRISRDHDMAETLKYAHARIIAVCDVDRNRLKDAVDYVNGYYSKQTGKADNGVRPYESYRELLMNKDIDGVLISTPDHQHSIIGIHAVEAGKDVYLQKPTSLTIADGRALSNAVNRTGRILQIGSQQRSSPQFRYACELVRNGRIGQLKRIIIGLPVDPSGDPEKEMPVPASLDYDAWLGMTPYVYYTEKRVHPQKGYDRPGWLRCEQFGAGMITGWGSHHIDIAHWGMNTEYTGPIEVWGSGQFPKSGLWDVHGSFKTYGKYANGVEMEVSDANPNGVRFEGTEGWIFVTRGNYAATASDPVSKTPTKALTASDPKIITSKIGTDEVNLIVSEEHHGNWLDSMRTRKPPIAPVEVGHRSCSACLLHHIAMKLNRKLYWDPVKERFRNDDEANAMLDRPKRHPYTF
jgi:predicted dehydrogenase